MAGALALSGCGTLPGRMEPVSVTVADLRMGAAGILEQQYFVKLRVQNPNDVELQVKGVSFTLDLNGEPFAKGASGEAVTVPRFGSALAEVETVSGLGGILKQVSALGEGGMEKGISYRIRGKLATRNAGSIAFDERGEFKLGGEASEPAAAPAPAPK
jgi:LEA14-like dessication related protein